MPAESRENPLLKIGNSDAFFREKYLTKNIYTNINSAALSIGKTAHPLQVFIPP